MYIQDNIVKTTAWTIATPVSRKNNRKTIKSGRVPTSSIKELLELNITQLKPASTAKRE